MKKRIMYYRRKGKQIIAEGQAEHYGKKKTVYLFSLPPIEKLLKSSIFTAEKTQQILEKIARLKESSKKGPKSSDNDYCANSHKNKNIDGQSGE